MANGNLPSDMWKELPTWMKAVLQLGVIPAAFAWMLYVFSTNIAGDVRELKMTMQQHAVATDRLNEQNANRDLKLDILIRIQQTQCVNAATDVLQRRDCINAGR